MRFKSFIFLFFVLGIIFVNGCSGDVNGNVVKNGEATIYKSLSCGCCGLYSNYLQGKSNFDVNIVDMQNINSIKRQLGVPTNMESCHTTKVLDYFVEGHIPLEAIDKLLSEKPEILGIAMPGMPSGSPGMPGRKNEEFTIYSINKDGSQDVFMKI
jgi:hypothetical protein